MFIFRAGSVYVDGSMVILKKAATDGEEVYLPDLQVIRWLVVFFGVSITVCNDPLHIGS